MKDSAITAELGPISQSVSEVAALGLQALDDLQSRQKITADAKETKLAMLKDAAKPKAVLVDKLVAPVEMLVNASAK